MIEAVAFAVTVIAVAVVTATAWRAKHRPIAPPPVSRLRVTKRRRMTMRATRGVPDAFASMDGAHEFLKSTWRH